MLEKYLSCISILKDENNVILNFKLVRFSLGLCWDEPLIDYLQQMTLTVFCQLFKNI